MGAIVIAKRYVGKSAHRRRRTTGRQGKALRNGESIEQTFLDELASVSHDAHIVEERATCLNQCEKLDPNGPYELLLELGLGGVVNDVEGGAVIKHMISPIEGVVSGGGDQLGVEVRGHGNDRSVAFERDETFSIIVSLEHQHHRARGNGEREVAFALARVHDLETFDGSFVGMKTENGLGARVARNRVHQGLIEENGSDSH